MVQDFYFLVLTQVLLSGTHFGHLWSVGLWRQWRFTAATRPWFSDTSAWEAVEVHKRKLYNLRWHWFTLKVNFFLSNSCSITYVKKNQTNVKVADFESFSRFECRQVQKSWFLNSSILFFPEHYTGTYRPVWFLPHCWCMLG